MKKIFYWFLLLCLSFTSCNDEGKVVLLTNDSPKLTVTSVSPQRGYVGAQVTIEGTDFGADASLISVFFSDVEEAAELVSCEDTKLIVKVPVGATDGAITVKVRDMTVQTDDSFIVVPDPVMESVSPESIYAGTEGHNEIMVTGSNFGTAVEDVRLYLVQDEEEVEVTVSACEDNKITAKVTETAVTGECDLKLEVLGRAATNSLKLTLKEKPVITAISTDHPFSDETVVFAAPGDVLTITGQRFEGSAADIEVKVGDVVATSVSEVSDMQIKAIVPDGFAGGKVTVTLANGIYTTSETELQVLAAGTDVSAYALENYQQPFESNEDYPIEENGWSTPKYWTVNEAALIKEIDGKKTGGLNGDMLMLQTGTNWGSPVNNITNGKMYQTTTLPEGNYKLTVNAKEYRPKNGTLYWIAVSGSDVPDVPDVESDDNTTILGFVKNNGYIDGGACQVSFEFSVPTDGEVSLGCVLSFGNMQNFKVTSLKLEYTGETTGNAN